MPSIKDIQHSVEDFLEICHARQFAKTYNFKNYSEKELLPLLRFFFAGRFGRVVIPECPAHYAELKRKRTHYCDGRLDFLIGNVAVEVAVRPKYSSGSEMTAAKNYSEANKLSLFRNAKKRVLILMDFSKASMDFDLNMKNMKQYMRDLRVGKGNKLHPFTVIYTSGRGKCRLRRELIRHK